MSEYGADWRAAGACLSADPDLFFPISTGAMAVKQITMAQQVCARCGVRQQCLDFAIRSGEVHGIWGGTTPEDRIRAKRARSRARRIRRTVPAWETAPDIRAS